ncbi:PAS domain-containing sensor histidine kinase [Caulobacter sp. 73W]|uniref:histidine kinase n=1 Tax=Caulobacter sp. 73W TaxID=3161137 RepID=A0AB39KWD9_9CAUL
MKDRALHSQGPSRRATAVAGSRAAAWHGVWLAVTVLAGAGLIAGAPGATGWLLCALAGGAAPALAGLTLDWMDTPRLRSTLLGIWALGAACAVLLTGGASGPLAAWCLAPAAAAALLGGPARLAQGASLSLMVAALAILAPLAGFAPIVPPGVNSLWLGALALGTISLGFAAGLILHGRGLTAEGARDFTTAYRLNAMMQAQPNLILAVDLDGRVQAAFGDALEGVEPEAVLAGGLAQSMAIEDRPRMEAALRKAQAEGRAEVDFSPAGALDRTIAASIRVGREGGLVASLRDATADRAREAVLEQGRADAEAIAANKARFLANMSHELRTPLNAIMGFSDIMRAKMFGPLPDRYAEYSELIHESGAHLLDLINDVLDMSKIEAERFQLSREIFDAREAVSAALRLMRVQADGAGVKLRGVLPAQVMEVDADRRAIKQIALNLISNALKFTPKKGSVTVSTAIYEDMFELIVADSGVGISPADLERLGKPFEQAGDNERKAQGTGLGLSLVRAFAELHGGVMHIESVVGSGTSVTVRLPVAIGLKPSAPPTMGGNVVAFSPGR